MHDLDLAWETFDFHSESIAELEANHLDNLNKLNILLNKQVPATRWEKVDLVNKILACCDKLQSTYIKSNHSINDLIKIYNEKRKHNIPIPIEHKTDIQFFNELKNVNATLIEEMKVYKSKIREVLD